MLGDAIAGFLGRGYHYIGMDHFALPDDALAVAKRQGRLHRNFQGYSTQPDCDLIGLGVSSIGKVGANYYQNAKTLDEYYDALRQGQLPVQRGIALTRDDVLRRAVIMALMCQGRLEFESIELAHLINMREYFARELEQLQPMAEAGLVELEPGAVQVTATGWYVVRAVAMVFDRCAAERQAARALLAHHLTPASAPARHQSDQRRAAEVAAALGHVGLVLAQRPRCPSRQRPRAAALRCTGARPAAARRCGTPVAWACSPAAAACRRASGSAGCGRTAARAVPGRQTG